jgi:hypothetical protein
MFSPDVVSFRQYYASPLGEASQRCLARALARFWPQAPGDALLAVGYALPYVDFCATGAAPQLVCMPAEQGAVFWPAGGPNRVFMAHADELPLSENSVNRILLIHALEHSEHISGVMRELWRVLTPGGRVLVVVPSRMGFWSRAAGSPFGYGRPFSMAQLKDLFSRHQFTPMRSDSALFTPPTRWQWVWRGAARIEMLGRLFFPFLGGVLLLEAEKQLYAAVSEQQGLRKPYRVPTTAKKPVLTRE